MEIDAIFGYAKLSVMQISLRVVAILSLTTLGHLASHAAPAAETPTMKAIVAHEYGGPEVLKFEEVPRPEPKENEALVRDDRFHHRLFGGGCSVRGQMSKGR
jgi:hypothetical protein